jgi:hypothetical protein
MKRGLALLLTLFLAGTVFSARAESIPYTLQQKVAKQLGAGSGIKGTLTFSAGGDAMPFMDAAAWQLLVRLLPRLSADFSFIRPQGTHLGESRVTLAVKADGNDIAQAAVTGNGKVYALESSLMDGLAGAADPGDVLISALRGGASAWPPLWLAAFSVMTADEEWNTASVSALATYTAKLGVWLQAYTTVGTIGGDEGNTGIRHTSVIPPQAVKTEAKQLLIDLYADDTLLSLLQARMTAGESAAYLQKSMMPSFFSAIDALPLSEDVRILRTYDTQGNILSEEMVLPLAGVSGLSKLTITRETQEDGAVLTSLACDFIPISSGSAAGASLRLTITPGAPAGTADERIYSGTIAYTPETQPETESSAQSGQVAAGTVSFSYNLYFSYGAETYDAAKDLSTRGYEATLVLKPESGLDWNALSLSLTASLSSGSSPRTPTVIASALVLRDLVTDSHLEVVLNGRTTAPWTFSVFNETNVVRIDLMAAGQLAGWLKQVSDTVTARVSAILLSLASQ